MRNAFGVVDEFERRVAEYSGAKHAVAVDCCTNAIFLCLQYAKQEGFARTPTIELPARTYVSVPMACIHAGFNIRFRDFDWTGIYPISPFGIWDGAKRFRRGMYEGGLHCLSFHSKKILNIGRGGMVLTDDVEADEWLRRARYDGRAGLAYANEHICSIGWHSYMTPPEAARGLQLLDVLPENVPDQTEDYPDLRKFPVFDEYVLKAAA